MGKTSYEEYSRKIIVVVIPPYFCQFVRFVLKYSISHTANVPALCMFLLWGIIFSELYFALIFFLLLLWQLSPM